MSDRTMYTAEELAQIREALEEAQAAQTRFWEALRELEDLVGGELNIDNDDLENLTVEDVIGMVQGDDDEGDQEGEEIGPCVDCSAQCVDGGDGGTVVCPKCDKDKGEEDDDETSQT